MSDNPKKQNKLVIGLSAVAIVLAMALVIVVAMLWHPSQPLPANIRPEAIPPSEIVDSAAPTPPQPPRHFFETKAMDSAIAAYNNQWDLIRKSPKEAVGKSYTWTAKVAWILGESVGLGAPGRIIQYDVAYEVPPPKDLSYEQLLQYNGMVSRGLPDVYKDDMVCFTGTFTEIIADGALEFEPTTLLNYGKLQIH